MPPDQARVTSPPAGGAFGPNAWLVDDMFEAYRNDPSSVSESWREFFADYVPGGVSAVARAVGPTRSPAPEPAVARPRPRTGLPRRPSRPPAVPPATAPPGTARARTAPGPAVGAPAADALRGARGPDRAEHGGVACRFPPPPACARCRPSSSRSTGPSSTSTWPAPRGQGQLHPPHRLRRRAGARGGPRAQRQLRARRRGQGQARRGPPRPRRSRPGRGPREVRRDPHPARPRDQRGRDPRLPGVRHRLRGHGAQGPHRQGRRPTTSPAPRSRSPTPARSGTVQSVPRLMPGQGAIIGVGALGLPGRVPGRRPRSLAALGVGPVVTLTSTYDHRIIQGAESGLFLTHVAECLTGRARLLRRGLRAMDVPYEPVRWQADVNAATGDVEHRRLVKQVRRADPDQHVPGARPSHRRPRPAVAEPRTAPRARPHHLRPDALGPRPRSSWPTGWRGRETHAARDTRHPARRLLPHPGHRVHAHPGPRQKRWIQQHIEGSPPP